VAFEALIGSIIAFVLIVASAGVIYILGRRAAPKPVQTDSERSSYACGENVSFPKLRVNVSLYRYLIYFVIIDSSVLLLAYASFMSTGINVPLVVIYMLMLLAAGLLLFEGGKKK
jgi:NADH:ubiquinone oxidoreductase subunit 3 (subunit A)